MLRMSVDPDADPDADPTRHPALVLRDVEPGTYSIDLIYMGNRMMNLSFPFPAIHWEPRTRTPGEPSALDDQ